MKGLTKQQLQPSVVWCLRPPRAAGATGKCLVGQQPNGALDERGHTEQVANFTRHLLDGLQSTVLSRKIHDMQDQVTEEDMATPKTAMQKNIYNTDSSSSLR
ncbi:hypothetical protein POM88_047574 [Heracleum sosnowskyi]|uniref:Uncharacterized protein n=1 Tax=Heracleum sosnowskyi TaxID=360622 RepID=A0AAD8LZN7_9APIA|nr:hypothetical protein POM88_047574 [Heracleum sosnowskyi]